MVMSEYITAVILICVYDTVRLRYKRICASWLTLLTCEPRSGRVGRGQNVSVPRAICIPVGISV